MTNMPDTDLPTNLRGFRYFNYIPRKGVHIYHVILFIILTIIQVYYVIAALRKWRKKIPSKRMSRFVNINDSCPYL